ncbi:N-terminal C2 in EEIG1 and EHBP1 proteins domain containing protein [Rhypophila decipiens]
MQFLSLVNKARKIYDLNNVPLVSGVSLIKWHIPHSIHGEHRGRTQKCPIANHRVEYNYSKLVPLRIAIDRNNNLSECWIEFEVLQEFSATGSTGGPTARDEKITLGTLRINLSEYVEESAAHLLDASAHPALHRMSFTPNGGRDSGEKSSHHRRRSSMSGSTSLAPDSSPRSSQRSVTEADGPASDVQEGVIRRYLLEDAKINSTLKIGILMVQVDGERNYIAPPLKTAAVFGGIAGIVAADGLDATDQHTEAAGQMPLLSHKSRELFELQDAYRRVLTASWTSQPGELPADQCIEDIFAGGDGFRSEHGARNNRSPFRPPTLDPSSSSTHGSISTGGTGIPNRTPSTGSSGAGVAIPKEDSGSNSGGDLEDLSDMMSTLRPRDRSRLQFHLRNMSTTTVMGNPGYRDLDKDRESSRAIGLDRHPHHRELLAPLQIRERLDSSHGKDGIIGGGMRSRSESLTSLATTLGSDRGRDGFKRAREVDEFEIKEDLVCWAVPGIQSQS